MMKRACIMAIISLMTMLLFTGCKSPEEIDQANQQRDQNKATQLHVTHKTEPQKSTMQITGVGVYAVQSDYVTITASLNTMDKDKEKVQSLQTEKIETLTSELYAFGIEYADIKIEDMLVLSTYQEDKPTGYEAVNQLTITLRDIEQLEAVMEAALSAGIEETYEVKFQEKDTDNAYKTALTLAMEDAQKKAAMLAEAAGVVLNGALDIAEIDPMESDKADSQTQDFQFTGKIEVVAQVAVTYEIITK